MKKINLLLTCVLLITILSCDSSIPENTSNATDNNSKEQKSIQTSQSSDISSNWNFVDDVDKMTGKKMFQAYTTSTNKIDFDFPYQGGSSMTLYIRQQGQGNEVFFVIDKGQILTGSDLNDHNASIKFDDGKIMNFGTSGTTDGSSDCAFIENPSLFIKKLKASNKMMAEFEFFDHGKSVFEFDTKGLVWDH